MRDGAIETGGHNVATISDREQCHRKEREREKRRRLHGSGGCRSACKATGPEAKGWDDRTGIACLGCSSHRKKVDCHRIAIFNIVEPAVLATRK